MAAVGLRKKIQFGKMANPGDDRRTRSQTAQSFVIPIGDFEGESGDVPTSTPSETTQMMVEFFRAEERRAQRDKERAEREAQQWEKERRFAAEREAQQREEERRFAAEREAQQQEEERRFAAEQQQRWIDALQNARPTPPVAALPRLSVQKFNEETDDMAAYLDTFEAVATASEWPEAQWSIHLRGSLSGAGLLAISTLNAVQQADFQIVKKTLLSVYQISTETRRRKVFERTYNPTNPDQWLREFRQNFHQWLDSIQKPPREAILTELVLSKIPAWLEAQMRNLDCQTYEELTETIVRHLGNSKLRRDKSDRKEKEQYRYAKDTPSRFGKKEPPKRTDAENAKCSQMASPRRTKLPEWTKTVKINGKEMKALLDTGCTIFTQGVSMRAITWDGTFHITQLQRKELTFQRQVSLWRLKARSQLWLSECLNTFPKTC